VSTIRKLVFSDPHHFKLLNDSQGHLQGDAVLKTIATALEDGIRIADFLTVSLGYTHVQSRQTAFPETWERVVERADRALYKAKQSGRNCVVGWEEVEQCGGCSP
jgi:GGDEF domain-containing protein